MFENFLFFSTVIYFFVFCCTQPISGASYREYTDNKAAFEKVLSMAIAAGTELNIEDIYNLVVTSSRIAEQPSDGEPRLKEGVHVGAEDANHLRSSANQMDIVDTKYFPLRYTIIVEQSRGLTYREIGRRVYVSVNSGQFASLLQAFAVQENVPELTSATSPGVYIEGSPFVDYSTDDDDNDLVLSVPIIVGIAIGGFAFILALGCCLTRCSVMIALYHCICPCKRSVEPQEPVPGNICAFLCMCVRLCFS